MHFDQPGYKITRQGGDEDDLGRPVTETFLVVREEDGRPFGAYYTLEEAEAVVDRDKERARLEKRAAAEQRKAERAAKKSE